MRWRVIIGPFPQTDIIQFGLAMLGAFLLAIVVRRRR